LQDDTLPGAILKVQGQSLVVRDSLFSNLAHGADGTLIAINSTLTIQNTTFASNSQASAGALFLNNSQAVIYDSLFDHNRGWRPPLPSCPAVAPCIQNWHPTVFRSSQTANVWKVCFSCLQLSRDSVSLRRPC
jgi:hypothetical protein